MGFEPTRPLLTTDLAGLPNEGLGGVLSDFKTFCVVDLQLTEDTAKTHAAQIRRVMHWLGDRALSQWTLREYLGKFTEMNPCTYANVLKSLKVFCRDFLKKPELVESFKFPQVPLKPKTVPTKKELQQFYQVLDSPKDRALFLLYASSGLRRHEALSLSMEDIDFTTCTVKPKPHNGRTKNTWLTVFNNECAQTLKEYLASRKDSNPKLFPMSRFDEEHLWYVARAKMGIAMTPQILREWFCNEMGSLGVQDRYIDAFCGRVPKSILARHYSDYSPERLREIYRKTDLKVLS